MANWIEPRGNGSYVNYGTDDYQIWNSATPKNGCFYNFLVFLANVMVYGSLIVTLLFVIFMIFGNEFLSK